MCNKEINDQQQQDSPVSMMDSVSPIPNSVLVSDDEIPRAKFLCSFLGSILPRPQDGKLRYVGGETRILSVPRDIKYEDLMNKMRELYDGAAVLKYQQPDEDLDALVSVLNDDDVTNMMEEYDKLGSADGFTRLRIFLYSHPDLDGSSLYGDGDEKETEWRYLDALNNLNDTSDFGNPQQPESFCISPGEDIQTAEPFWNPLSFEGALHGHRGSEIPLTHYNLHHLNVPQLGSGQHHKHRYTEMDGTWSPSYCSPKHHGHHDPRPLANFPTSPSSARYFMPFPEVHNKGFDRMPEEYARQPGSRHPTYEQQSHIHENVVWVPTGPVFADKGGFPGNFLQGQGAYEGNTICGNCRLPFHQQQHLEHSSIGNGHLQGPTPCPECTLDKEALMGMADPKVQHGIYVKDQTEPRSVFDVYNHEGGRLLQHPLNPRAEEVRTHNDPYSSGRLNDHYLVDSPGMNYPLGHRDSLEGHHMPSGYVHRRPAHELLNDGFRDHHVLATLTNPPVPQAEERGVHYGNSSGVQGDNLHPLPYGHSPLQISGRHVSGHVPIAPSYEASGLSLKGNSAVHPALIRVEVRYDEASPHENVYGSNPHFEENLHPSTPDLDRALPENLFTHKKPWQLQVAPSGLVDNDLKSESVPITLIDEAASADKALIHGENKEANPLEDNEANRTLPEYLFKKPWQLQVAPSGLVDHESKSESVPITLVDEEAARAGKALIHGEIKLANPLEKIQKSDQQDSTCKQNFKVASIEPSITDRPGSAKKVDDDAKPGQSDFSASLKSSNPSADPLGFLPELIESVKKVALEGIEEVKAQVEENDNLVIHEVNEVALNKADPVKAQRAKELDSDDDNPTIFKIEPTKAEAEAIARGLQTIKNDDLEEIRELGSGTYGAVYHGKWKGSDVAIKRIKASCFSGKPSERERLIADFWKEALLLSSLHHPNVVSFYGIVRDGPDGSLATLTEFMVNGSLKQFLHKKDRTIDRRKRLLIAMDAAFGMEYLHEKNIVHFDLKCENLLVNMRDPQRPVCKIGDLGLSKVKQHTLVSGGVRGTLPWMAPELLSGKSNMVTEKIDVYSFGIVMWEVLTGEEPYAGLHCASIIGGIVNDSLRPTIPQWCDPEWRGLMESCWTSDPSARPSFTEISQKLRNMAAAMNLK